MSAGLLMPPPRWPTFGTKDDRQTETESDTHFGRHKSNGKWPEVKERRKTQPLVDLCNILLMNILRQKVAAFGDVMPQPFEDKGYNDECSGKDCSGNIPVRVL